MCLVTASSVVGLTQMAEELGQPGAAAASAAGVPVHTPRPGGPGVSVGSRSSSLGALQGAQLVGLTTRRVEVAGQYFPSF